jgi:protein-S-isoprenylcysteine O-methyltransferase
MAHRSSWIHLDRRATMGGGTGRRESRRTSRIIRYPAYLGHLASLLGIGLVFGNWVGLTALVVLPLAGILYRIHVEERALLEYFGSAYQAYASRTKRLLPGIW